MPGLGAGHVGYILILLVIVLIIWGPGKLPDIGSGLGRGIREFRKASSETRDEFHRATQADNQTPATPAPPAAAEVPVAPVPQPAPVGGVTTAPGQHPPGEGDQTTAV